MMTKLDLQCCDRCRHEAAHPCPQFVICLTDGPQCHTDERCRTKRVVDAAVLRRVDVTRPTFFIGMGTCGLGAGAAATRTALETWLETHAVEADIVDVGCIGLCAMEPLVDIQIPGRPRLMFHSVSPDDVVRLAGQALAGMPDDTLLFGQYRHATQAAWAGVPQVDEHPFFAPQKRFVLENCGRISPIDIGEYIAHGRYRAFADTIRTRTPAEVCACVETAGLRGRGGGGFPAGKKWQFALREAAGQKYLVCNADEGDPGAFMDRAVIEGDPHRLIEGMAIAAYAIGATKAYVYIRAEYPQAIDRLREAIRQARAYGFLGYNILDSGMTLDIAIKAGAGAFVCGEETALINSIEGRRGMPRPRPPFPAVSGLFGKPTVINNVETLANVPVILRDGGAEFGTTGTANSRGTKVFALSGKVTLTGLVEVPMGTSLRSIIFAIGGGIPDGRRFKAVQIGGPSGGCIPEQHLDIDIDYESLKTVGAMMGSGGLVVMDETTCMVDLAKFFMDFIQRESCGKCIPCREGTRRLLETLQRITSRKDTQGVAALERFRSIMYLERLTETIRDTSLCGLGQTAPNPVLSTLRFFRDEYEAHIYERRCPAGACAGLITYRIEEEKCVGCTACAAKCPVKAIHGKVKSPHYIVADACIACGACVEACKFGAVVKE